VNLTAQAVLTASVNLTATTIAHGLPFTPTHVAVLCPAAIQANKVFLTSPPDATNLYLRATRANVYVLHVQRWEEGGGGGESGPHGSTHEAGGGDELAVTALAGYPGGTSTFLRADGAFAAPPGGSTYTDEQAQDAVGSILQAPGTEIDLAYNDTAPGISANLVAVAQAKVTGLVAALASKLSGVTLQAFTTPGAGTYTPTPGMKSCVVFSVGGGGGGGGADCTGLADAAAGAGGGAGATAVEAFTAAEIGASKALVVGAAGTAGANTGGTGGTGGSTTFGPGPFHTAAGGVGGAGAATGTANVRGTAGGAGGAASGGLLNVAGGDGGNGLALLTLDATDTNEVSVASGGAGGSSFWGGGGRGGTNAQDAAAADSTAGSQAGVNGAAFGAGGGGGAVLNTATGVAGGAGAAGAILIMEFT
jgi:hypothetical protein